MRRLFALLLLPLLAAPALADDPPKHDQPPAHHGRLTWEQRFEQANHTHDGHLTLDEANEGDKSLARHFHDIDVDSKGYVTENDVRAWRALRKASRKSHREPAANALRPRNAFQERMFVGQKALNASTNQTVPVVPDTSPSGSASSASAAAPSASLAAPEPAADASDTE